MPLPIIHLLTSTSSSPIHRALRDMDCFTHFPTRYPVYHQDALAPRWLVGIYRLLARFAPTVTIVATRLPSRALRLVRY
jgi:hypothetical protein